jgi:hypothetical protein
MEVLIPPYPQYVSGLALHRWGRVTWRALHGLTFLQPKKNWRPLLEHLSLLLPCPMCCMHLQRYLVDTHTSPPDDWFVYTVDLHNHVNTQRGCTTLSVSDIHQGYTLHCTYQTVLDATWEMIWILHASADRKSRHDSRDYTGALREIVHLTTGRLFPPTVYESSRSVFVSAVDSLPITSTPFRWWSLRYPTINSTKLHILEDIAGPMTVFLLEQPLEKHVWEFLNTRAAMRRHTIDVNQHTVHRSRWVFSVCGGLIFVVGLILCMFYIFRRRT